MLITKTAHSDYPNFHIFELIHTRMREIRLRRSDLIKRIGYSNINKGLRRLEALVSGDGRHYSHLRASLAHALKLDVEILDAAMAVTSKRQRDQISADFKPHAIILTANKVPSPIFAAALIGAERLLRIEFEEGSSPVTFAGQVLKKLPIGVPTYGKSIGFIVNYRPDYAVQFQLSGKAIDVFDRAVTTGTSLTRVGSRPFAFNMETQ